MVAAETRDRLIRAAERLFAEHGVMDVSLREISRAAKAKNNVALQYHFDDRVGILRAILERHWARIEPARMRMLDEIDETDTPTLRDYARALVLPSAAQLQDEDGGREYLRIYNEIHERGVAPLDLSRVEDWQRSIVRWHAGVAPLMDPLAVKLHRRYIAMRVASSELARLALSGAVGSPDMVISHVVDIVAGVLSAPVSDETRQEVESRRRAKQNQARPTTSAEAG